MVATILLTIGFSAVLAFLIGIALAYFNQKFKVERDPKIEVVREALPGANCGACGYPGCDAYAEAVATGRAPTTKCSVGGSATAGTLAKIMGDRGGRRRRQCRRAALSGLSRQDCQQGHIQWHPDLPRRKAFDRKREDMFLGVPGLRRLHDCLQIRRAGHG